MDELSIRYWDELWELDEDEPESEYPQEPGVPVLYEDMIDDTQKVGYSVHPMNTHKVSLPKSHYSIDQAVERLRETCNKHAWKIYQSLHTAGFWCWEVYDAA